MKLDVAAIQKFRKAAKGLQKALDDAREIWPNAELYLASGTLHLMKGEHHSGQQARDRQDNSLDAIIMRGFDGGDW